MNRIERIKKILNQKFKPTHLILHDNSLNHKGHNNFDGSQESHFCININKPFSSSENRISIHRKIYKLLKDDFQNGLHALEIKIAN